MDELTHLIMESTSLNSASNPSRLRAWLISSTVIIESPFLSNMSKIRRRRSELRLWLRSRNDFDGDDRFISPIIISSSSCVQWWMKGLKNSGNWKKPCIVLFNFVSIAKKKWKNLNTNKPCSYVTPMNGSQFCYTNGS